MYSGAEVAQPHRRRPSGSVMCRLVTTGRLGQARLAEPVLLLWGPVRIVLLLRGPVRIVRSRRGQPVDGRPGPTEPGDLVVALAQLVGEPVQQQVGLGEA